VRSDFALEYQQAGEGGIRAGNRSPGPTDREAVRGAHRPDVHSRRVADRRLGPANRRTFLLAFCGHACLGVTGPLFGYSDTGSW
jgi:hypothetical protein